MKRTTPETRPWLVAAICTTALALTWISYFAVYAVLPDGTPAAHWGLLALAIGSTGGLLVVLERLRESWLAPLPADGETA